ncbi:MAG: SGNH/GDSL hydrolase family protein [Planctomycetota bacterium]
MTMRQPLVLFTSVWVVVAVLCGCSTSQPLPDFGYLSPDRFEQEIRAFEAGDAEAMPPENALLFVGSSSIRMWHKTLAEDMAPLTVIGRGFGGSNANDLLHFYGRIVLKYQPRAVVIYEGDNDVDQSIAPLGILATYERLLDRIEADLPGCRVYLLAVKPSPMRWALWPTMLEVNEGLAELADERKSVVYIDIATPMLGEDGKPRADLFIQDNLHLNRRGYQLWRNTIRPVLIEVEKEHE